MAWVMWNNFVSLQEARKAAEQARRDGDILEYRINETENPYKPYEVMAKI